MSRDNQEAQVELSHNRWAFITAPDEITAQEAEMLKKIIDSFIKE